MTDLVPDVSFIIAAYNAEDTIGRAIDSALGQGGVNMEVIVIDDCSSDRTRDIVGNHPDPRVRLVAMARNGGPGAARNAGLDVAQGRWVSILDSDDALRPDRLARMIARGENAGAQIVVDNLDVAKGDGEEQYSMFPPGLLARFPTLTLADFIASNVIFKSEHNFGYMKPVFERAFLERHALRFDETLKIGEDYILLASALALGGLCVVEPMAGYIYYIREGSISRVLRIDHVDAMLAADGRFLATHTLDGKSLAAQRRRSRSLRDARSFLLMIEAMKRRSLPKTAAAILANPRAALFLRMPIAARLRRALAVLERKNSPAAGFPAA